MPAKSLMVLGTASNVGKSILVTALCRHFSSLGVRVVPFKAQNMSLNSAATPDGFEIGRAQALQAEAARVPASADMNPVLIKPSGDTTAQLIVQGRIAGNITAGTYFREQRGQLFERVLESYGRLADANDLVVIEGAGSPAEINLRENDIVNMAMARAVDAPCLLAGDIDRGGVFASLLGTLELLDTADRACIKAFAVNKFRGDVTLLQPGIDTIERRLCIPCAGIIPYIPDIGLDDEDSVEFYKRVSKEAPSWNSRETTNGRLRMAVIALPYMSNFTDFDPFFAEPSVEVRYTRSVRDVRDADLVIIPGTKQTIADLDWLRESGFVETIRNAGTALRIFGVCGGMQMLGSTVRDPDGVEGGDSRDGLGLLPLSTTLTPTKTTISVVGSVARETLFGRALPYRAFNGYEIHVGTTTYPANVVPFSYITRDTTAIADGAVSEDHRVAGTYVHGIFHDDAFRHAFIDAVRRSCGLDAAESLTAYTALREERLDRVAGIVSGALNLRTAFPQLAEFLG